MVLPLVPFLTPIILRIFWIGYITMYLSLVVDPQRNVRCISILPGTGQFYHYVPLYETVPLLALQSTYAPPRYIYSQSIIISSIFSLCYSPFYFWVCVRSSPTYACIILFLLSVCACSSLDRPTWHTESGNDQDNSMGFVIKTLQPVHNGKSTHSKEQLDS